MLIVKGLYPRMKMTGTLNALELEWSGTDNVMTDDEANNFGLMYENDNSEIYLSVDDSLTFKKYVVDKTREFDFARALPIEENTLQMDVSLSLIEV